MNPNWLGRNQIVANLFNPAFCGEIIAIVTLAYTKKTGKGMPFAYLFILLPILLHKTTRDRLPRSVKSHFFVWVEQNNVVFFDFPVRAKSMKVFTKEAIVFLMKYNVLFIDDHGLVHVSNFKERHNDGGDYEELEDIFKKSAMLGKWLAQMPDVKSIYTFLRIIP